MSLTVSGKNWIQKVGARILGISLAPPPGTVLSTGIVSPRQFADNGIMPWVVEYGRRAVHRDIQRMVATDPIMSRAARVWGANITSPNGDERVISIDCKDEEIKREFEELRQHTQLDRQIKRWAESLATYGNVFVDKQVRLDSMDIIGFKILPEDTMIVRRSPDGRLGIKVNSDGTEERIPAYAQTLIGAGMDKAIELEAWQVTHFADDPISEAGYGTSLYAALRRDWKALEYTESSLVIARIMRAYSKIAHIIPMPANVTPEERTKRIEEYKKSITRTEVIDWRGDDKSPGDARSTLAVDRDIFMTKYYNSDLKTVEADAKLLDPQNQQLQNINDVEHMQRKLLVGLGIPPALLGIEADVNARATVQVQEREFGRECRDKQAIIKDGVREIFDVQLLFHEIDPRAVSYELYMPEVQMEDNEIIANTELTRAQTAQILAGLIDMDPETVAEHYTDLTRDEFAVMVSRAKSTLLRPQQPVPVIPPAGNGSNGAAPADAVERLLRHDPEFREYVVSGRMMDDWEHLKLKV